jgi:hypothetical protein
MKEKILIFIKKHSKIIVFVFIISLVVVTWYFTRTTFKLNIIVTPNDSTITISNDYNTYSSIGIFSKNLRSDLYNLKIEKKGYITEQRQVKLDQDTKISMSLFQSLITEVEKSYTPTKISPIVSGSGFENGIIYGINRKNGDLVRFEDKKETVVYSGDVKDYDVKNDTAVILDNSRLGEIVVLNLNSLSIKRIFQSSLSPIVSVALSGDAKMIYFLAEFDISNKSSSLNSFSISDDSLKKISETTAQSVKVLSDNLLLLLEENHGQDKNVVLFYDLEKKSVVFSKTTNSYKISPDKNHIFFHKSTTIDITNTLDFKSKLKNVEASSRSVWKDNNTIVIFRNNENNIYYSKLTIEPFEITPFQILLEGSSLLNVFGFMEDRLYLQDYKENIFSVETPIDL